MQKQQLLFLTPPFLSWKDRFLFMQEFHPVPAVVPRKGLPPVRLFSCLRMENAEALRRMLLPLEQNINSASRLCSTVT